eukprot:TRINITY_DN19619_c0_g1_i1.p2 TRINITY_DN19619_c0_g1~~TRINITY_DN19619_c0_g1_i1.p2  ORF type:complete len:122 (-),score=8.38 TRINITY_DN19619_c0_g1_i1:33-359(-)
MCIRDSTNVVDIVAEFKRVAHYEMQPRIRGAYTLERDYSTNSQPMIYSSGPDRIIRFWQDSVSQFPCVVILHLNDKLERARALLGKKFQQQNGFSLHDCLLILSLIHI